MSCINNMVLVNNMSYVNSMSYVNYMSIFMNCSKSNIIFFHNI